MSKKKALLNSAPRMLPLAYMPVFVAVLSMILFPVLVCGFEIPTGTEDFKIRFDNTLRYSYANRVAGQNSQILNNPNTDDGDRNFSHATVGNRIDLLPEMDAVYLKDYGLRVSGAAWYDFAYDGGFTNNSNGTSNHLENGVPIAGRLNDRAKRDYKGLYGEFMDAFVFGKFHAGEVPINVKVGRHTVYWGESLLIGGALHGISYGQSPIDVSRGLMLPGAEVKELFRPLNQVSIQVQPTDDLTIMGQYFMEWDSFRYPEAGTYLGFLDPLQKSGESLIVGPDQRTLRGSNSEPDAFKNWGVAVRYKPDWLEGTVGLYYRKFADMQPQLAVSPTVAVLPAAVGGGLGYTRLAPPGATPAPYAFSPASIPDILAGKVGNYYLTYGQDIDLAGISLSKQVLGVSVGAEFSYRWNMPLISTPVLILPAPLASGTPGSISFVPTNGQTAGARGETMHTVLNLLGTISQTPLFDTLTWMTEFTWNRLSRVTQNAAAFKTASSGYTGIDAATKDFFGAAAQVTPTWYQVFAGVDMTMPLSYSRGLSGVSCITGGGAEDAGTWSAGLGFDYLSQYKFDLKYINFFGPIGPDGTAIDATTAGLKDRDMVTFTFSTKF